MLLLLRSSAIILVLTIANCKSNSSGHSRAATQNFSKENGGPSHQLKKELLGDSGNEWEQTYPPTKKYSGRIARNNYDFSVQPQVLVNPEKIKPGQYADNSKKKTSNWDVPDFLKNSVPPADSKFSWSFWETDDSQSWLDDADDADDSQSPTTTTTTTKAPKVTKEPVSVHKHYIYFKKAAPWPSPSPPMSMHDEMMPMMPEEMMQGMMKGMMPSEMKKPQKKGVSGIIQKLSAVDPITILVAGVIPASLILAAAIPSVMNKMMNANKGDTAIIPPMTPVMSTTASGDVTTMSSRQYDSHDSTSVSEILQAASQFGFQSIKDPKCARRKFCRFAKKTLLSNTPEFQSALRIATVAMEDSWLDTLGVRDILQSLILGTCDESACNHIDGVE